MALTRDELLDTAGVTYTNAAEPGIGGRIAPAGFDEQWRLAGLERTTSLQTKITQQQNAKGEQHNLTQILQDAQAVRRGELIELKQAVRTADTISPPAEGSYYTRLNLKGATPRGHASLVAFARTVYSAILEQPDLLQAISGLGYTQEQIEALLQGIAGLETLNARQEKAKGDYQALTQEVKALEKALWADLSALKKVIKALFSGEEESQVLATLQLTRL